MDALRKILLPFRLWTPTSLSSSEAGPLHRQGEVCFRVVIRPEPVVMT